MRLVPRWISLIVHKYCTSLKSKDNLLLRFEVEGWLVTRKLQNKIQLFDTYKPVKISSRSQAVHLSTQDFGIFSEKVKNCACNIDTIKYIYYKLFSSMCNLCTVLLICNSYLFFILKSFSFSPFRIRKILYFSSGFPNNWERWYNSGRSGERPAIIEIMNKIFLNSLFLLRVSK